MNDRTDRDVTPTEGDPSERLDSWKEIASYLKRDVRTVQRWERDDGLPVHRLAHGRQGTVYAQRPEIDRWWASRRLQLEAGPPRWKKSDYYRGAVTAAAVMVAIGLAIAWWRTSHASVAQSDAHDTIRFALPSPVSGTLSGQGLAISRDGHRVAFAAQDRDGRRVLWLRELDSAAWRRLPGTEDGDFPFWSPNGMRLGFFARGRLRTVDVAGGELKTLCEAATGRGATWSQDDVILFARSVREPLYRVSADGGPIEPATALDRQALETGHLWPQFLPDGRHFLFLADAAVNVNHAIKVGELGRTESRRVVAEPVGSGAIFASPSYLLYSRDEQLVARPYDLTRLEATGNEFPILEEGGVRNQLEDDHYNPIALSANNVFVYRQAPSPLTELVWRDRTGARIGTLGSGAAKYESPVMSADGTRVAVSRPDAQGRNWDIWILNAAKGSGAPLFSSSVPDTAPVWSADGKQVAFRSFRHNADELYIRSASGSADERRIIAPGTDRTATDWSPDGRTLIVNALNGESGEYDIWAVSLSDGFHATPLIRTPHNDTGGRVSPDGHWIAYVSDDSGTPEVFVQRFPYLGDRRQISTRGGTEPMWRHDGRELFYLAGDGHLMSVSVHPTTVGLGDGPPVALFEARPTRGRYETLSAVNQTSYAVAPDGQRFLFNVPLEDRAAFPVMVVVNWSASQPRPASR